MKRLQRKLGLVILLLAALIFSLANWTTPVRAQTPVPAKPVCIYLFWGDGCPHCAAAKPFLKGLSEQYPNVELRSYEVWNVPENQELFKKMAAAYGFEPHG
ncbi:MAG: thioredoxin family protein, partial [Veillonellaceae bacterium]|nr:thioredoxin family protein [Veillonellaceae bacterium]